MRNQNINHSRVKNEVLLKVGGHIDFMVWNNETGTARAMDNPKRIIKFGKIGSPDILGVMGPFGLFVGIEIKTGSGRQRESQIIFEQSCKKRNGIYIVGRHAEDALDSLLALRVKFCERWGLEHLVNYSTMEIFGHEQG